VERLGSGDGRPRRGNIEVKVRQKRVVLPDWKNRGGGVLGNSSKGGQSPGKSDLKFSHEQVPKTGRPAGGEQQPGLSSGSTVGGGVTGLSRKPREKRGAEESKGQAVNLGGSNWGSKGNPKGNHADQSSRLKRQDRERKLGKRAEGEATVELGGGKLHRNCLATTSKTGSLGEQHGEKRGAKRFEANPKRSRG